jgi:ribosomal protein S14
MSVLLPPSSRSGSAVRPILQERRFKVSLRCIDCGHEHPLEMSLYDEPNNPATRDDFYDRGIIDRIHFECVECGCQHASYRDVIFIKDETDAAGYTG